MQSSLCQVAREAIFSHLKGQEPAVLSGQERNLPSVDPAAHKASGVFVTLWDTNSGREELRGCIGRHQRKYPDSIAQEIADCAILSATEDPRFPPLELEDLKNVKIEISLLGGLEPCTEDDLNPHRYGIVVRSGYKGATLLPGIEGIDTVTQQLSVTRRKAGIRPDEEIQISRFPVTKISE
ncbi:MAG: AmmeMemoRadiSam system protein A [Oligoflexia bacterium]|nr:MAG: AmmeMemoRadiSam system protein A [Oligoflexia bacterium]